MDRFLRWGRQPTTVTGFATLLGTVSAVLSRSISLPSAIPLIVGAVVAMIIPDNTAVEKDAEAIAKAAVQAYLDAQKKGS